MTNKQHQELGRWERQAAEAAERSKKSAIEKLASLGSQLGSSQHARLQQAGKQQSTEHQMAEAAAVTEELEEGLKNRWGGNATATLDQIEAGAAHAEEVISSEDENQDNEADDTNEMSMPLPIRIEQEQELMQERAAALREESLQTQASAPAATTD